MIRFSDANPQTDRCFGLALSNLYMRDSGPTYNHEEVESNTWSPCDNCQHLISLGGGDVKDFAGALESSSNGRGR